jgi:IS4 transposase
MGNEAAGRRRRKCSRIDLPGGGVDTVKYKLEELGELYRIRWAIEEGYKMYKARVQVEAFSGKTAIAVKQDI